jgi:hypothetical protein
MAAGLTKAFTSLPAGVSTTSVIWTGIISFIPVLIVVPMLFVPRIGRA